MTPCLTNASSTCYVSSLLICSFVYLDNTTVTLEDFIGGVLESQSREGTDSSTDRDNCREYQTPPRNYLRVLLLASSGRLLHIKQTIRPPRFTLPPSRDRCVSVCVAQSRLSFSFTERKRSGNRGPVWIYGRIFMSDLRLDTIVERGQRQWWRGREWGSPNKSLLLWRIFIELRPLWTHERKVQRKVSPKTSPSLPFLPSYRRKQVLLSFPLPHLSSCLSGKAGLNHWTNRYS